MEEKYWEDILKHRGLRCAWLQLQSQRFSANIRNVTFDVKGRANIVQQLKDQQRQCTFSVKLRRFCTTLPCVSWRSLPYFAHYHACPGGLYHILHNITMHVLAVSIIFCTTLPCMSWRSLSYFAQHYHACPGGLYHILHNITMRVLAVSTIFFHIIT